ncbi:MAG: Tyrosyl-tRNA synthetase 1 [uncultured bacterium (gcode 4)]|uniref:Tyrosine--tRNA ligase n=1 Tax=uncultured bacterium (gcode 4) TaxID=1234023 RepID=K2FYQ8_9BACT|nr:MAG: Tyrosyl-tRNA synthetase 1 [uncultured bacterium (gcode 4)]
MNLKQELELRWFLHQYTHEELFDLYDKWWEILYWWIDPSADSFQLGNFISLLNALHYVKKWNQLYLIVWWATWMIWNPTGKSAERNFLTTDKVEENAAKIQKQMYTVLENVWKKIWTKLEFKVINNYDFFKDMNVLDFMREVWKYMTVNWMMNKDIVKKRIIDPDQSISYAEFSYMLIMWYDFFKLFTEYGVKLEVWWADEWDGILSWVELVWKKTWKTVYWATNKLITDSTWKKFWKSEGNAIWLDPNKNSPYFVYQYLLNISDEDVDKLLKLLTFMDLEAIAAIVNEHSVKPELRLWQKALASYVTEIIFWKEFAVQAEMISEMLFWSLDKLWTLSSLSKQDLDALAKETGSIPYSLDMQIVDAMISCWFASSKWDARKLIEWGWIFLNEKKVEDISLTITDNDFHNNVSILRKWKKNFKLIIR